MSGLEFLQLMPPEIEILHDCQFQKLFPFLTQSTQLLKGGPILLQQFAVVSECVNQDHLLIGGKQRLMVMGTMQIDQPLSNLFKDSEGGLRTIDKLPVAGRNREDALEQELTFFAGVDSLLAQHLIHLSA